MKKALKLTLAVVCVMFSTSLFAQKFGRINTQEIITNMNEFKDAQTQIQDFAKDLDAQLETIQVEFNNKLQEYQKAEGTMTEAVMQLKQKEQTDQQEGCRRYQRGGQGGRIHRGVRYDGQLAGLHRRVGYDRHQRRSKGQAGCTVIRLEA